MRAGNHMSGLGNGEAMFQGVPFQMRVHQGGDDANLGKAHPDRDIVRAILHAERHPVPGLEAVRERPMGHPVRLGLEFGISGQPALEAECNIVGMLVDAVLEIIGDQLPGVRRDLSDQLVHPDGHAQEVQITFHLRKGIMKGHGGAERGSINHNTSPYRNVVNML